MSVSFSAFEKREILSTTVSREIEEVITQGKFKTGSKLRSENELCLQFNVSRTVIREALKTLHAKGLVSIRKGVGVFVEKVCSQKVTDIFSLYMNVNGKRKNINDVMNVRLMFEPVIAGQAALNRTEEDINLLRENLKKTGENTDAQIHAKLDFEFHLLVAKSTHNNLVPLIFDPIHNLMPDIKSIIMKSVKDARESALKMHSKIISAIEDKNEELAFISMKEHINIAIKHFEEAAGIELKNLKTN